MKEKRQFKNRQINMNKMISALIVYAVRHTDKQEEIYNFLFSKHFVEKELFLEFCENLIHHYDINSDLLMTNLFISRIDVFETFEQKKHFKDELQREKNKVLIDFCKKIFNSKADNAFRKFCFLNQIR